MLEIEKTIEKFGYSPATLKSGSGKMVVCSCDYCGNIVEKEYKAYIKQTQTIQKTTCDNFSCRVLKREETSLIKYGTKNAIQTPEIKRKIFGYDIFDKKDEILKLYNENNSIVIIADKLKMSEKNISKVLKSCGIDTYSNIENSKRQTMIDKMGEDYREQIIEKGKQTNRERYGCDNPFGNKEIREKRKKTMVAKYGTEHPTQNKEIYEKLQQTNLERYGHKCVTQVEEFKQKTKQTNLEKYGCESPQQNEEIKNKTKKTCKERYGYENPSYSPEIKDKILQKMIDRGDARIIDGLVIKEHAKNTGYAVSTFNRLIREYGFEEASKMHRSEQYSSLELIFKDLLNQNNINFNQHSRLYYNDNNYYIPDFQIDKLFIEIDGLFWHCDCHDKMDRSYHSNKQKIYIENGYDSLFFREDELRDKFDIVKSITLNKLGKSNRIFARKCVVKEVDTKTSNKFFEDNHLMGRGKGRTFALFFNDEIVSAIRVKRLKNKEYEVSRFCHKLNTNVIGGFSKLLKFVENQINMDSLTTFIDKRYGKGEYLADLGFEYIHTYPSFKWTNGINTYHRLKFPSTSGYDNGFFKIYDCGQAKFVKTFLKSSQDAQIE